MKPIKFITALAFIFTLSAFSQNNSEDDKLSLNSGTIYNQFEYVIKKSGNFRGTDGRMYESVRIDFLPILRSHTIDSLKVVHKDLADTQLVVKNQAKEISDLKLNLSNTKTNLDKTNTEKNNISLFGMQMSKTSYNVLMWSIIAGLLALLLFFIYKYNNSNAVTKDAKHALSEIEDEFEEHRKTALEREQKVRRQLQDEINKQKGV